MIRPTPRSSLMIAATAAGVDGCGQARSATGGLGNPDAWGRTFGVSPPDPAGANHSKLTGMRRIVRLCRKLQRRVLSPRAPTCIAARHVTRNEVGCKLRISAQNLIGFRVLNEIT